MGFVRWDIASCPKEQPKEIAQRYGLSVLAAGVLAARGYTDEREIEAFLEEEAALSDPYALVDMEKAVERIREAVEEMQRIAIYGDYDADGVTSTVILYSYLESLGADVIYYIPERDGEGYGLNRGAIDLLRENGAELIVTVDNGVTAVEEIAYAGSLGIDVVVTDHHQPPEKLPEACAVVDPHRADDTSAFKDYCGAGVVFKLVCALEEDDGAAMLDYYADILCLGTVADLVPLRGENRLFVKYGLQRLMESENPGVCALAQVAGITGKEWTAQTVAFTLAPRINAAGRLGSAQKAVQLLLTEDEEEAMLLAQDVDELNARRKQIEAEIVEQIVGDVRRGKNREFERVLVLAGEGWHHGVVGIAAAKIVERYDRPCFLISVEDGEARGSGRSVEGFSLHRALTACSGCLTRFGGHAMAAGLSLAPADIPRFTEQMRAYTKQNFVMMPARSLQIDRVVLPGEVGAAAVKGLSALEPFGRQNEPPLFAFKDVQIAGIYPIGGGKHLRLKLTGGGQSVFAVYFGMTAEQFPFSAGDFADVAFSASVHVYAGEESVTISIKDMRPSNLDQQAYLESKAVYEMLRRRETIPEERRQDSIPTREETGVVYRCLKAAGVYPHGYDFLYTALAGRGLSYCKVRLSVDILHELRLVQVDGSGPAARFRVVPGAAKADLAASRILQLVKSL